MNIGVEAHLCYEFFLGGFAFKIGNGERVAFGRFAGGVIRLWIGSSQGCC